MYSLILIVLLSYLIGSFPTSIVWGRMTRRIDIREYGSGNAGGTNALRVLGWQAGSVVALIDVGKGMLAAALVSRIRIDAMPIEHELVQIIAGTAVVVGHIWTVLALFKGGKGVATAAGVLLAIYPWVALICFSIFATVVIATRYVSLGSITAVSSIPFVLMMMDRMGRQTSNSSLFFSVLIGCLIFYTHRGNIRRLLDGTENRFEKELFKKRA